MADDLEALIVALRIQADTKEAQPKLDAVADSLGRIDSAAKKAKASMSGMGAGEAIPPSAPANAKKMADGIDEIGKKAKTSGSHLLTFSNFMRTAFGTLTAMLIFKVGQAVTMFFTNTLQAASQFRSEMTELNLAEAILSKKGMDITRQELDQFIKDIESKTQYLSKLDATKVVADTAGAVQEFDVTKTQMKDLADSIAFIQMKNKMLGREEADAAHIINAAMDARSNFFNGMGINITEALIKEKAYEMQLVKTGQEIDKASRFQAVMALLTEQTASKQGELNKQLEGTPLGNQMSLQKEWADAQLRIGDSFITVRDNIIEMLNSFSPELANNVVAFFINAANELNILIDSLQTATDAVSALNDYWVLMTGKDFGDSKFFKSLSNIADALMPFENLLAMLQAMGASLATLFAPIITLLAELASGYSVKQAMQDAGNAAGQAFVSGLSIALETLLQGEDGTFAKKIKEWWKKQTGVDLDTFQTPKVPTDKLGAGTPTGTAKEKAPDITAPVEDVRGALDKMNNEILEAQLKLAQDMEDAAIDLGRKMEDITIEYEQKRADAYRDYSSKIADINRDYSNKIADINAKQAESRAKAQADERQKELEHQNKLQELREKFLMDLDDALHARDARQILKLIKQYDLDKLQAEREFALQQENAKKEEELRQQSFANERAAAERDRKAKIAEAQQDYADKLAKLKADEEAERAAAQLKYEREKQDLEKAMQDRLEIVAANLVAEFNLTASGLNAIVALYHQYYSEVAGIYMAMQAMIAGGKNVAPTLSSGKGGGSVTQQKGGTVGGGKRFAEGGMMIADQPTSVIFGDNGLEAAQFTPIGRNGADVNKIFSNLSGAGGQSAGGNIGIEILLSPDLESRIVNNTLSKTAQVFTKVQRTKR